MRQSEEKIVIRKQYNSFIEAFYLAGKIKEIHESGTPYKEIAIFYRLQNQSQVLEDVFLEWFLQVIRAALYEADRCGMLSALTNREFRERFTKNVAK